MSLSSWLQNHPNILELAYNLTDSTLRAIESGLRRVGLGRLAGLFVLGERLTKVPLFGCRMCGQCILHSTGMTCPMTCPKNLRNGPCGGVRLDGNCEVKPDMPCVWVVAWERAAKMGAHGQEIHLVQAPVDKQLAGTSAWLNALSGRDASSPRGWIPPEV